MCDLEGSINKLADEKRLESMNLFLEDWHNRTLAKQRRLDRNPLIDTRRAGIIKGLDVQILISEYTRGQKGPQVQEFINKRVLSTLDLLKLQ